MKPTIKDLAKHLSKSPQSLYQMQKAQPKQWALIWSGWQMYCRVNNNSNIIPVVVSYGSGEPRNDIIRTIEVSAIPESI